MDYKKRINELKDKSGLSIHRLAIEGGLNPSTVSNWFNRNSTPTTDALENLCVAFGITMSTFFNETGEIVTLTNEQKELLKQWDCLLKNEKAKFLELITTLNDNRKNNPL